MVYNGPSTGCLTCRKRKVRCDKGRPECHNCLKRKQQCPGYGDVFDTRHRDQTRTIIARADHKTNGSGKAYLTPSTSPGGISSRATSCTRGSPASEYAVAATPSSRQDDSPLLPFNMPVNLEASAINFFFQNFGRALGDCRAVHGFMPDLVPVFRGASVESPVHAATASIAMNMYMLFAHQGSDTKQARSLYLKAVSGLKERLTSPEPGNFDELIMAVLALDFYDTLNSKFWPDATTSDHHKRGALALLRHRGPMNFSTELSRIMVSHVRTNLSEWAIENETELPPDILDLVTHPSLPNKNQNMLDLLSLRLASLRSRFRALYDGAGTGTMMGTATSPGLESLLDQALQLDEEMMDWEASIPPRWHPVILTPAEVGLSIRMAGVWNDRCPVYADLAICDVYNTYRHRRLQLLQLVQKLCLSSKRNNSADIFDYKGQIMQRLVNEICESVPFCVGDAVSNMISNVKDAIKFPSTWRHGQPFPHPSVDHPTTAIASGGWIIYTLLECIMELAAPERGLVPIQLSSNQLLWVRGQLRRIAIVYTFKTGPK